jgi:hypothetical protein
MQYSYKPVLTQQDTVSSFNSVDLIDIQITICRCNKKTRNFLYTGKKKNENIIMLTLLEVCTCFTLLHSIHCALLGKEGVQWQMLGLERRRQSCVWGGK